MIGRIVFLLEEPSMKVLLEGLLPRLFPDVPFLCVAHEGKQDLEKSAPRKLRAWREPGVRFLVLRDQDAADCRAVKDRLRQVCRAGGREDAVVRIACRELEAWYLGEPDALAEVFRAKSVRRIARKRRYRDPDRVVNPSRALRQLVPGFQKVSGARRMADRLTRERNRSASFQALLRGIERLHQTAASPPTQRGGPGR